MRRLVLALIVALSTLPASAQTASLPITRVAFASCFNQAMRQPIWEAIFDYRPELFIFAGDNVYGSAPLSALTPELPILAKAYAVARSLPQYERIRREAQVLAVWDDHDYGLNDGGVDMPYRQKAKDLFLEFWDVAAGDPRRGREGLYDARIIGPAGQRLQVILLDTRWFRSPLEVARQPLEWGRYTPTSDKSTTMLGPAQWAWLAERLREPAELRLIVSSVQVVADGHNWERWGNFPHERQRLFDLVRETDAKGVILVSGDRHIGGLYRETRAVPYPLLEATASPGTAPFPGNREPGPNRIGGVYGMENFGTVDIDWWERAVTLSIRSINGEPVRRIVVPFDALRAQ